MATINTAQTYVDLDKLKTVGGTPEQPLDNTEAASGFFQSDEIWLDAVNKIFYFKGAQNFAAAGSGVTGQALYSFFKDVWKEDSNLPQYPFPMLSITNEQFEFQNGWKPADGELVGTTSASDITFAIATDDTITSAADIDFAAAGFTDADYVVVSGSTDNDGYYRVKSASGGTLTLEGSPLPGTAGADTATISIYRNAVYQAGDIYTTREMIRTAGWSEVGAGGGVSRRYFGAVTLGALTAADQTYYVQDSGTNATPVNTSYAGAVNQAVQWYGNTDYGDTRADDFIGDVGTVTLTATVDFDNATKIIDFNTAHSFNVGDLVKITGATAAGNNQYVTVRSVPSANEIEVSETLVTATADASTTGTLVGYVRDDYFKIFVRTRKSTYADADLTDIGVSQLTYIVYRFPLTNADDLNINTTNDNAFTTAAISSISGDGTTITVQTSVDHGLYTGAPVFIVNTGVANFGGATGKVYTILSKVSDTEFTISSGDTGSASTGTTQLGYTNDITVKYMVNPVTTTLDVVLRGDYADATAYAAGDVVFDVGNSETAVGGPRWYYADIAGTSSGANVAADSSGITWTYWDPAVLYGSVDSAIGAYGGQRNIEEDASATLSGPTDGIWSAYTIEIDGNAPGATDAPGATKEVLYEYAQYLLRQTGNINDLNIGTSGSAGSVRRGDIADPLVFFVGSTLNTYRDGDVPSAVMVDDIAAADVNNIQYNEALSVTYDGGARSTAHRSPIVVTVSINFNTNLTTDADAVFYAYYTTGVGAQAGNDFGTTGALQLQRVVNGVESDVGSDISNQVSSVTNGVYEFNYAFDADTTNGRTGGTDVPVTVVAIGLETGQYVLQTGTITEAGGAISLVAPLERNFTDPE